MIFKKSKVIHPRLYGYYMTFRQGVVQQKRCIEEKQIRSLAWNESCNIYSKNIKGANIYSWAPGRSGSNFESVVLEHTLRIKLKSAFCEIVLSWMP